MVRVRKPLWIKAAMDGVLAKASHKKPPVCMTVLPELVLRYLGGLGGKRGGRAIDISLYRPETG